MPFGSDLAMSPVRAGSPLEQVLEWSADLTSVQAGWRLAIAWAVVVVMDASTGRLMSLNGLYMLPLCFTTWCLGRVPGLLSGAAAVAVTLSINGFGDGFSAQASTVPAAVAGWNTGMRIFAVTFTILLVGAFRRTFDRERVNARIDPLTGLGNRRAFAIESRKLALAGIRDDRLVLCGLIDLDDFKRINDDQGHAAGDRTLRVAADALAQAVRSYDVTARIGGDELAFCLLVRDRIAAERKAADIHQRVSRALAPLPWAATCSLGATTGNDLTDALARADRAMYAAKDSGKGAWRFLPAPVGNDVARRAANRFDTDRELARARVSAR